ncbi:MAG: exodeoxyribonuclease V subunit gamma, partial [Bradymonadaceae bacterium]
MAGIELVYSAQLEGLVARLAEQLRPRIGDPQTLFDRLVIVVPNGAMQAYILQELSRRLGITPNIEFAMLRRFLAGCLPDDEAWKNVRILGQPELHHILVELLGEDHLPGCDEIHTYLDGVDDPVARERRRYQLARELSRIFTEYGFSRSSPVDGSTLDEPALLETWRALGATGREKLDGVEGWQQCLWWRIFGDDGVLADVEEKTGLRYITLADAFKEAPSAELRVPATVHLVGFSYIARLFVETLNLFGERSTVYVHGLLPERSWAAEPPVTLDAEGMYFLLQTWGAAGADLAKMWARVAKTITSEIPEPEQEQASLLKTLQADVLDPDADFGRGEDESHEGVTFFECPSIKREVEAVAGQIWTLLQKNDGPTLRPDDIAVVIAGSDQAAYQAQIEAVFSNFHNLPYSLVELPATSKSRVLEAARLLLALPFGRFTRRELLRLLVHPNMAGRGSDDDVEAWQRWTRQLGIIYGADRAEQSDGYLGVTDTIGGKDFEWDVYNWDQGMRRLTLGTFLSGARSGEDKLFRVGLSDYEPLEIPGSSAGESARFMMLASSLIADARWLASDNETEHRSAARWSEIVVSYLQTYLSIADGDDDAYEYTTILRLARNIADNSPVEGPMGYRTFYEFLKEDLDKFQINRGARLCGGVVVSTALALRAIPFDHIFVVGLGEGQFPNPEREAPLDLRFRDEPQLGDLTPANRDRYTFLEVLLAAQKSITLSWVADEATTGEALEASSVVNQLRSALEERLGVPAGSESPLTVRHPLRRYDGALEAARAGAVVHPEAKREGRLLAMLDELTGGASGGRLGKMPSLDELRKWLDKPGVEGSNWPKLRDALELKALPSEKMEVEVGASHGEPAEVAPRTIRLTLSQLHKFLESPLQGAARVQLGLKEEDDDLFEETREGVEASTLHKTVHLRNVMHEFIKDGDHPETLETLYEQRLLPRVALRTEFPAGYFLGKDREQHIAILNTWRTNMGVFDLHGPFRVCGIGIDDPSFEESAPPIVFELEAPGKNGKPEPVIIELRGKTDARTPGGGTYVGFFAKEAKEDQPRLKYLTRNFVNVAAAMAAGLESEERGIKLVGNTTRDHVRSRKETIPKYVQNMTSWREQVGDMSALDYLRELTRALLFETNDYLMPIDYVVECLKADNAAGFGVEALEAWTSENVSSSYVAFAHGPIKDYSRFGPPSSLD